MHLAYPLAYRNPAGLFTIGFVCCPVRDGVPCRESAELVEIVSDTMIRACCGESFADAVARAAQSVLNSVRERGEPDLSQIPKPFTGLTPVTSFLRNRGDAISSLAMMISEFGPVPQPSSARLGEGLMCGEGSAA